MSPARVLVVCTGNVCRSPFVERVLTARLAERGIGPDAIVVDSAGTHGLVGEPMTDQMSRWVRDHGGSHDGFAARLLDAQTVQGADLVLALTREHRGAVARLHPRANRCTFTLRELVRLVGSAARDLDLPDPAPGQRLRALVPQLAAHRGRTHLDDPADDDVRDPYGRRARDYRLSVEQMLPGVDALVWALVEGGR